MCACDGLLNQANYFTESGNKAFQTSSPNLRVTKLVVILRTLSATPYIYAALRKPISSKVRRRITNPMHRAIDVWIPIQRAEGTRRENEKV